MQFYVINQWLLFKNCSRPSCHSPGPSGRPRGINRSWHGNECNSIVLRAFSVVLFKMATNFKEAVRKVPRPSKLWNPFGFSVMPRRFPRQRRGSKRQPIVPLKEWKIIRGDTVSNIVAYKTISNHG